MSVKQKSCKACGSEMAKSAKVCPQCGKKQRRFPKWLTIGLGIIGLIWVVSDGIDGYNRAGGDIGGNSAVKIIKESSLGMCPNKTVGQMVSGYFGSPKWSSGKSQGNADIKDGQILVNVKGKISYMDKPVDAVLQFKFSEDGQKFEVQALEINGLPQNAFMITGLLENMCKK